MQSLSILIPTYRFNCVKLVTELREQCETHLDEYEIIVLDDCSADASLVANEQVSQLPNCRLVKQQENQGKSKLLNEAIRLYTHYSLILLIDCDAEVCSCDFITNYMIASIQSDVVCGSIITSERYLRRDNYLRFRYETHASRTIRSGRYLQGNPYHHFSTFSVLIHREVFSKVQFDESIQGYGYEDTIFGLQLQHLGIKVIHIDNPLIHTGIDSNISFVTKTENAIRNLAHTDVSIKTQVTLSAVAEKLKVWHPFIMGWHFLFGRIERKVLCSSYFPSLKLFKLYKLGYYIQISHTIRGAKS